MCNNFSKTVILTILTFIQNIVNMILKMSKTMMILILETMNNNKKI